MSKKTEQDEDEEGKLSKESHDKIYGVMMDSIKDALAYATDSILRDVKEATKEELWSADIDVSMCRPYCESGNEEVHIGMPLFSQYDSAIIGMFYATIDEFLDKTEESYSMFEESDEVTDYGPKLKADLILLKSKIEERIAKLQ